MHLDAIILIMWNIEKKNLKSNIYEVFRWSEEQNTFVRDNMDDGDIVVDIDNIWQCVSNCDRYVKPNRLRSNVFQIRDAMLDMIRTRNGNWLNAWIIGGYPLISERERLCKRLNAREIFIDTSKDECIQRLHENPDGRDISEWEKYIKDWWEKYGSPRPNEFEA